MPALRNADQDLLHKLLLGQLSIAEVERLATEYADDSRLAELAESLAGKDDALLHLLHNHETAVVDPEGERLVERLVQRLKPAIPVQPRDDTAAVNRADASTEPSLPAATGQPQKLPERLEYYRPIKVLGQGGMGTVYLAEDTRLGREVAIKTLRPELAINPQAKERFLREARSAAKLEHDHIIPIYSVGEAADGTPFLAMPFLKGEPLDALIRRTAGSLPVAMVVRLAREMASGLAAAHARGLIHRDIKPANIWLEAPTGRVKILDFGLAKAADAGSEADSETNLTASGAIVGTPAYMAPEQASGHAVDGRADLFSLGCVLYELLAGKRAFSGPNTMSILMSLANHTPPAPDKLSPQCPAALSRLVMQLLEKDPAKRPASAEAVIQALSGLDKTWPTLPASESDAGSISHDISNPAAQQTTPPGSPTRIDQTQSDRDVPNDTVLLSLVTPARKPTTPKKRVALALTGVLLTLLAAVVYRIQTDNGTLVVTIEDPAVQAILEQDGLVIRDKNSDRTWTIKVTEKQKLLPSGKYQVEGKPNLQLLVTDDSGAEVKTDEFTLKRKGERRVRVTMELAAAVAAKGTTKSTTLPTTTDSDRRAAEWVLSIGGTVGINKEAPERQIKTVGDLPRGTFELTVLGLFHNGMVSDAGLAHFKDCKNLTGIHLGSTQVSDTGLAHFRHCQNLTNLHLANSQISDAGLALFKDCKNLQHLDLNSTKVTDAGLAHFQDCKNLRYLQLGETQVSGTGLAYFKGCKELVALDLRGSKVSDAELALFEDCKHLQNLYLPGTQVSDAGLEQLTNHPKLDIVSVTKTKVTEAGVKKLSAALPMCKIEWDGGVIEQSPSTNPDRRAAEYVLSIGGGIKIKENSQERDIKAVEELPRGAFELTAVNCHVNPKVNDAGLAVFKDCKDITFLSVSGTQVSDAGLAHFQNCQKITELDLNFTKVGDAGLAHFKDCKNLSLLHLMSCTQVTDAGLANFKECQNLTRLFLGHTQVSDAGLAHFKNCKNLTQLGVDSKELSDAGLANFKECQNLTWLELSGSRVTDAGLMNFKDCKNLGTLGLRDTRVSDAGLEQLAGYPKLGSVNVKNTKITETGVKKLSAALPGCKIEWDGGVTDPKPTDPDRTPPNE